VSLNATVDSRPRRHPDAAFRAIGEDGGLVVLPGQAVVKVLNPVGSTVFGLLDGENSVGEIAERIVKEFDVTEDQALGDIRAFLFDLAKNGMLADAGGAPS
jgi:hypothetical protein